MNIFDLKGPEFLCLYGVLCAVGAVLALFYTQFKRSNGQASDSRLLDLTPYEIAYLRGGQKALTNAVLAHLVQTKTIESQGETVTIRPIEANDPVLQELARSVTPGTVSTSDMRIIVLKWANAMDDSAKNIAQKLERMGLLLTKQEANSAYNVAALLAFAPLLVAVPKVFIGIDRGKPVAYLCLMIFINIIVALLLWSVRRLVTSRGEQALKLLGQKNQSLQTNAKYNPDALTPMQVALAAALFGPAIFSDGMVGDFHKRVVPPSAGGSGCSSGSSCGGGGCGGGGCGGCGG